MSLIYSLLKPLFRAAKPKKSAMTREDWVRQALRLQSKPVRIPRLSEYDVRTEIIGDTRCIVIAKPEHQNQKTLVYYAGGGYIRYQLPNAKSIRHYIEATGRDLWIPLYPLFPAYSMQDAVESACVVHQKMLESYPPESIAWLGFSAGANIVMGLGRYIVKKQLSIPMPGIIVSVSGCNMHISEESRERMEALDRTDALFPGNQMELFKPIFDPNGTLPKYIAGCAAEDDYTGFPRTVLVYGGDEIMSGEAPAYEQAFRRCGMRDFQIHIEPSAFHAYPFFTFTPEGRRGEQHLIAYLK